MSTALYAAHLVLIALFALNIPTVITQVGQPRKPLTGGVVACVVVVDVFFLFMLLQEVL